MGIDNVLPTRKGIAMIRELHTKKGDVQSDSLKTILKEQEKKHEQNVRTKADNLMHVVVQVIHNCVRYNRNYAELTIDSFMEHDLDRDFYHMKEALALITQDLNNSDAYSAHFEENCGTIHLYIHDMGPNENDVVPGVIWWDNEQRKNIFTSVVLFSLWLVIMVTSIYEDHNATQTILQCLFFTFVLGVFLSITLWAIYDKGKRCVIRASLQMQKKPHVQCTAPTVEETPSENIDTNTWDRFFISSF